MYYQIKQVKILLKRGHTKILIFDIFGPWLFYYLVQTWSKSVFIDVIVTLHNKIQQTNTRYEILLKEVTMHFCNYLSFLFLFIIPLILPPLFLFQISY